MIQSSVKLNSPNSPNYHCYTWTLNKMFSSNVRPIQRKGSSAWLRQCSTNPKPWLCMYRWFLSLKFSLCTLMRVTRLVDPCGLITILQSRGKLHLDKLIWQAWRFNFFNNDMVDKMQLRNRPTLRSSYCDKGWIRSQRNGVYSQTHHESKRKLHNC